MHSLEINHLVFIEQHKDRIREIERLHLLEIAGPPGVGVTLHRRVIGWLGTQMVKWGAKLQDYDTDPTPKRMTIEMN